MANASGRWTYCGGATSGTARCQQRREEERHTNETGGEPDKKGTKSKGEEGEGDNEGEKKEGAGRNPPKERRKADKKPAKDGMVQEGGSFLCNIAVESESGNLVTFIVNVIFEVSST